MPNILLINPNTTTSITALLATHAQREVGDSATFQAITAQFGAPYIACETSYAIAAHAVVAAWAEQTKASPNALDGVLIGCFGDPGLLALRDVSDVPVTGLAEASLIAAAKLGRFAIVTGGARWKPMLERLASALGFESQLAGITTVAPSGAQLAQDPAGAQALLAAACQQAVKDFGVQAVILGGAGLAGMAARVQPQVAVPVIDSVSAGARYAFDLAQKEAIGCPNGLLSDRLMSDRLIEVLPWLGQS
jgi:Asp/Glu/hydantoin racemase